MARRLFLWVCFVAFSFCSWAEKPMFAPTDLCCNYLSEPLGIDTTEPTLSWKIPCLHNVIRKESKMFKYKKNNIINPSNDRGENITKLLLKNLDSNNKTRHKSVNYSNQRKILENNNTNNSLNNKYGIGKNSSGYINESSKQVLLNNNKSIFTLNNSKFQFENKYDNYSSIPTLINNNDFFINNINNAFNPQ